MLCRVFHKSKAENSNNFNSEFMFETTSNATLNLTSSPTLTNDQTLPCGYQQITSLSSANTTHQNQDQTSFLNLLQLSQDKNTNPTITAITSKTDEDYGFLWDDMELEDGVANFKDMRFEIDSGMVFL